MDPQCAAGEYATRERVLAVGATPDDAARVFGTQFDDLKLLSQEEFAEEPDLDQYSALAISGPELSQDSLFSLLGVWVAETTRDQAVILDCSALESAEGAPLVPSELAHVRIVGVEDLADGRRGLRLVRGGDGLEVSPDNLRLMNEALRGRSSVENVVQLHSAKADTLKAHEQADKLQARVSELEERVKRLRERAARARSTAQASEQARREAEQRVEEVQSSWIAGAVRAYQRVIRPVGTGLHRPLRRSSSVALIGIVLLLVLSAPVLVGLATTEIEIVGALIVALAELLALSIVFTLLAVRRLAHWSRSTSEAVDSVLQQQASAADAIARLDKRVASSNPNHAAKLREIAERSRATQRVVGDVAAAVGPAGHPRFLDLTDRVEAAVTDLRVQQGAALERAASAAADAIQDHVERLVQRDSEQADAVARLSEKFDETHAVMLDIAAATGPAGYPRLLEVSDRIDAALTELEQRHLTPATKASIETASAVAQLLEREQLRDSGPSLQITKLIENLDETRTVTKQILAALRGPDSGITVDIAAGDEVSKSLDTILHAVRETPQQRRASETSVVRQVQAILSLSERVHSKVALPPMGGWAVSPDLMLVLVDEMLRLRPSTVLECGSGVSTVFLALAAAQHDIPTHLIALEHDADHLSRTKSLLEEHSVSHLVEVRHAPLEMSSVEQHPTQWYAEQAVADLNNIELLFVDGPPEGTGKQARYPAVPMLRDRLAPRSSIILDDMVRPEERETAERWHAMLPDFSMRILDVQKGGALLRRG